MEKASLYEGIEVLETLPAEVSARGIDEETKKLFEKIKNNQGKVIKVKFKDKKRLMRAYHRLRDARKKNILNYKKIHRRESILYIVT